MDKEMMAALEADGEKLRQLTGEDHGPVFLEDRMFDFAEFVDKKWVWSQRTFGPGRRTYGIVDHLRKECVEILMSPNDPEEPIDVMLLAIDLLCRSGYSGKEIIEMLCAKQLKNVMREWPDWKTMSEDEAIEHRRE